MIQTIDLNKSYGSKHVLVDINLSLEDNKIYGLLGRNGVGKTSLLNILSNHMKASSGQALLDGEEIYENAKAVEQIAMVREDGVGRDIKLAHIFKAAATLYKDWDQAYADRLIQKYGINTKQNYAKLSMGERTMVGFIIGLACRCRYTFFDEPSLGLDAANRDAFYHDLLEDYQQHPRCIVIATHLIDEAANLFEEVIILKEQELLMNDSVVNLLDSCFKLSGKPEDLARFTSGRTVLERESFGPREIITLWGKMNAAEQKQLAELGIEQLEVSLQKLFVLLTRQ